MTVRADVSSVKELGKGSVSTEIVAARAQKSAADSLSSALLKGQRKAALSFAGQGANSLPELASLVASYPEVRAWVALAEETGQSLVQEQAFAWSGLYGHGFSPLRWIESPECCPPETYLTSSAISQPLIFVTQMARYQALWAEGLDEIMASGAVRALTGHSQGMMPALLVASSEGGRVAPARFAEFVAYFLWQGLHMARSFAALGADASGQGEATPMAAVSGLDERALSGALKKLNAKLPETHQVSVALFNTRTRHVVSGPARALEQLREALFKRAERQQADKRAGRFAGRVAKPTWEYIAVGAAFHSPYMREGMEGMLAQVAEMGFELPAESLRLPVISPADGQLFNETPNLTEALVVAQFVRSVRWTSVADALVARGDVHVVLALGPGESAARLLGSCLKGTSVSVLALATEAGQRALWTPGAFEPSEAPGLESLTPGLLRLPDGRICVDNRYTRATGQSPMILPGMTPTTADVPIVAAAANAGHTSELAGGGQVTEAIFDERMRELRDALKPGAEVVFNALYLDPYLWGMHLGRQRLVQKARRAGAPICGVTISAGIPEVDEAVRLLDEFAALGMWHNAFKPGTLPQIKQVARIARAASRHTVFVHLEGGRAGGHHSWEDLDQLLLDGYHLLRAEPNVVLCVGGGVGTPERAADLLTGQWSQAYGLRPMPVDAILLGTVTMAAREALTSPQVKRALVEAAGTDQWVFSGDSDGQVTSGRSQLNADIHYLDNAAARCGALLDKVAGDEDVVAERRQEIIDALNATAKPFFGELTRMSYLETLRRMVDLMAIGRQGRYEDGRWLDVSWRARFADFLRRAEARLAEQDEGSFPSVLQGMAELDDPEDVLERFAAKYADADVRTLHPLDQDFFVALCRRPGKPVNFVPVIDADVRRWYKSDSLWQAHDDRYDAEQVLAIPGPEALRGIVRDDEPVAELLGRFEQVLVDRLLADGVVPVASSERRLIPGAPLPCGLEREHMGDTVVLRAQAAQDGSEPDWFHYVARAFKGSLARMMGARRVYDHQRRAWPNPLRDLCLPGSGATLTLDFDEQGDLNSLVWRHDEAARVSLRRSAQDAEALNLDVCIDALDASVDSAVYSRRFEVMGDAFVEDREARAGALRDFYHHALFGELLTPAALFEEAAEAVTVEAHRKSAYAALTGGVGAEVPLNMAFSLVWRPLMRTLSCMELAGGLLDLVHLSNHLEPGPGWPATPGESLTASARVTRVEDAAQGRTVTTEATLKRGDVRCVTVHSRFFIRGDFAGSAWAARGDESLRATWTLADDAAAAFLAERPWLRMAPGATLSAGDRLTLVASLQERRPSHGDGDFKIQGALRSGEAIVGTLDWSATGPWATHPVRAALKVLGADEDNTQPVTRKLLAREQGETPADMKVFAQVSRDLNPIHRSTLSARMAHLQAPIVHGMWTAATLHGFLVRAVAMGEPQRVLSFESHFEAPASCGEPLTLTAHRVGAADGALVIALSAQVTRGESRVQIAQATARLRAPRTAYVLPGQGIQRQGMGMEGYQRSAAARAVWERADRHTRQTLGFSILRVVRENPREMIVNGASQVHPRGVLHLTQFTQVAMAVTAMAQVAELRAAGLLCEDAVTCGHSVGEYNALAAIAEVLPLESVVEIVYQRGCAMHRLVPRDAEGESGYRMGVIRPNCAGLDHAGAEALVASVREQTGLPLEIVNYNVRGWQYSVTGRQEALVVLAQALEDRRPPGAKAPYIEVPGIDVPFHSRVLVDGVASFRQTLQERLPARVAYEQLLGRYIPNLVPRPYSLTHEFVQEVFDATGSEPLQEVLADFPHWSARPAELARVLLIELLAWQFASPVRWIETQELLMRPAHLGGLGVERVIEVGVGYQPTLVGMARATRRTLGAVAADVELFNVEAHAEQVFHTDADAPEPVAQDSAEAAAPLVEAAPVEAPVAAPVMAAPVADAAPLDDRPMTVQEALTAVLALQARVRPSQIRADETIDDLFEGVSSRRNQVLLDLGAEFDAGAIDGAHEKPIGDLAGALAQRNAGYRAPGGYLSAAVEDALGRVLGRARMRRRDVEAHLTETWGFGPGWIQRALCALTLETREGASSRGDALGAFGDAAPADASGARQLLDGLAVHVAAEVGVALQRRGAATGAGGAVDAAAVRALEAHIAGPGGLLAQQARDMLTRLGEGPRDESAALLGEDEAAQRLAALEREHGPAYEGLVQPRFDLRRHVALESAWAWAQRDVARLALDAMAGRTRGDDLTQEVARLAAFAGETRVAQTATWYVTQAEARGDAEVATALSQIAHPGPVSPASINASRPELTIESDGALRYREVPADARDFVVSLWDGASPKVNAEGWSEGLREALARGLQEAMDFSGRTALVTGASPGSIALEVVRHLLRGGARVVVTTTTMTSARLRHYRSLYQACAAPGAELHVVPFNQASNQDVDALVEWLFEPVTEQVGAKTRVLKRPFAPDLVLPFGAMGDVATLDAPSDRSLAVVRAMLLGVERLVGAIGRRYRRDGWPQTPCHVVLPLSPNHGSFGGDGAYAETKAALEVMLHKWQSEHHAWGRAVTLCGARIGWVRGTGLMDANNPVAARLEADTGARTFSSGEMGWLIAALCTKGAVDAARQAPLRADLTGGFAALRDVRGVVEGIRASLAERVTVAAGLRALDEREAALLQAPTVETVLVDALPDAFAEPATLRLEDAAAWPQVHAELARTVVIVGAGEVGPWGHARTRFEVEVEDTLSAAGVLELAWVTGLVRYTNGQWVDAETETVVPEAQLAARYRDAVLARGGIRVVEPEVAGYDPQGLPVMTRVFLERDFTFAVASEQEARLFVEADPEHTAVFYDTREETWRVTRRAGAEINVPRKLSLSRRVAGLIPSGFDFGRYGVTPDMVTNVDRVSLFNLVATVDAFVSSGLSPEELMRYVHPARVANTQGSGIGGMKSLQRLYVDYVLGKERQSDVLQETLINVVGAYVVQSYVGSYGAMAHPVAACATAAVSLEEGMDKILAGRAEFVVAGGFDDIGPEGALGFSDMGATADTHQMAAMGMEPREISRPNDARRRGFVEAHGGGTLLLARGDVALRMGAPVLGVLGWAGSFGDGIHKSIPAPGLGALAAAMGGARSPLGRALSTWGLEADDIAMVYKHDTSTQANDPNENALHHRIQEALGRTPGNPLWAVSQKSLTGHPKGGAAAWQAIGLCQCLAKGVIPGNRNLTCVDEAMRPWRHLTFTDAPVYPGAGTLRAGLLTSLGFGHVGAIALLLHPAAFLALIPQAQREGYLAEVKRRRQDARAVWSQIWMGQQPAFARRTDRRFEAPDGSAEQEAQEAAILLNPDARFDPETGRFVLPTASVAADEAN